MSLYNMMHGTEPTAALVLHLLGANLELIPRLRDAWFTRDDVNAEPYMVVHTRAGGGNRDDYVIEIGYMQSLPGFLRDEDCEHDSTYADFYYGLPTEPENVRTMVIDYLDKTGAPLTPGQKFEAALERLKAGPK